MLTVVCVFNDRELLEGWLLDSLRSQTVEYELKLVDNTSSSFKSAASALNSTLDGIGGEFVLFVHQDVRLTSDTWLEAFESYLKELPSLGVAGVAGARSSRPHKVSISEERKTPIPVTYEAVRKVIPVQTVDECAFAIPSALLRRFRFDEVVCDSWHMYAVDYCLTIGARGFRSYVVPMNVHHKSTGGFWAAGYAPTLRKLLAKYRFQQMRIYTTCGAFYTLMPVTVRILMSRIVRVIRGTEPG